MGYLYLLLVGNVGDNSVKHLKHRQLPTNETPTCFGTHFSLCLK